MYTPHISPSCRAHTGQHPQPGSRTISAQVSVSFGHSAWRSAVQPGQRNTISAREAPARDAERISKLQPAYDSIVIGMRFLVIIMGRWKAIPSEKKGKKCACEQVKPGAGRAAGSYKFPGLLLGPHMERYRIQFRCQILDVKGITQKT